MMRAPAASCSGASPAAPRLAAGCRLASGAGGVLRRTSSRRCCIRTEACSKDASCSSSIVVAGLAALCITAAAPLEAAASSNLPWQLAPPQQHQQVDAPANATAAPLPPLLKEVFGGQVTVEWVFEDRQQEAFHHLVAQPFDWDGGDDDGTRDGSAGLMANTPGGGNNNNSSASGSGHTGSHQQQQHPVSSSHDGGGTAPTPRQQQQRAGLPASTPPPPQQQQQPLSSPGADPQAHCPQPLHMLADDSSNTWVLNAAEEAEGFSPPPGPVQWRGAAPGGSAALSQGTAAPGVSTSTAAPSTTLPLGGLASSSSSGGGGVVQMELSSTSRPAALATAGDTPVLLSSGGSPSYIALPPAPVGQVAFLATANTGVPGLFNLRVSSTAVVSPVSAVEAATTNSGASSVQPATSTSSTSPTPATSGSNASSAQPATSNGNGSSTTTATTTAMNDSSTQVSPAPTGDSSATPALSAPSALSVLITEEEALALPPLPSSFPDLPAIPTPNIVEAQLSNGLKVLMLEDHEVPLVRVSLLMRGGKYASPPDKVGLASISMAVQRSGGSVSHPGASLDLRLEELAAGVEASAGPQALTVDFFSSRDDLPEVLSLWAEVLRQPALPQDRLALYQDQVLNSLEHKDDNPTGTARRQLAMLMYGKDSVYARQPSRAGVLSITLDDVKSYLSKWERPDAGVLGVVGDFEPTALLTLLEREVGQWQPAAGQPEAPPERVREANVLAPYAQSAGRVIVFDRPGLTQASVAVAEPGVSLMDPDAYALDLLSTTLNSFGGQLFDQLRSREGLAYSVYGAWDTPPDRQGTFVGGGETSMPAEFIQGLRRVLGDATRQAPSPAALESARDEALNGFVFNFASKSAQLQRTLVYDLLGLPRDLLFRYRDGVAKVTAEDVLGAAQRRLHPEQQVTVVVADALQVLPQLEAAGLKPSLEKLLDADR